MKEPPHSLSTPAETEASRLLLHHLVVASGLVAATRSRLTKRDILADILRRSTPAEVAMVATYLSGALPQQRLGLGWRSLPDVVSAVTPTLALSEVDAAFEQVAAASGAGSAGRRHSVASDLFCRATEQEQTYLAALLTGTLRQGSLEGPLLAAMAIAYDVPEPLLRRGLMFAGSPGPLALAAATGGADAVAELRLVPGRAVRPMLAGSAKSVAAAFGEDGVDAPGARPGVRCVQAKLDGIRIQVHVVRGVPDLARGIDPGSSGPGGDSAPAVRIFTRSLDDITDRLPEVVEWALALPAQSAVLDGEALALDREGRPRPFQITGARTASTTSPETLRVATPLTAYFFDLLHLNGRDLLDEPFHVRHDLLAALAPQALVASLLTDDPVRAETFSAQVLGAGHEGVVVKDPQSPYAAGRRGSGWVKVKPRRTLDLVVLAVEPGSGRRRSWLSNIHLGARDPATGAFVMVGKTFKGMTDVMLEWQTQRFRELETHTEGYAVHVRPEQVVEVAFDGVQTSRRYPGGVALRFARVLRYRHDKTAAEADTIEAVRGGL